MTTDRPERATCRTLTAATAHDWDIIDRAERRNRAEAGPAAGLIRMMHAIADAEPVGVPVNLYTHCLQTADRVRRAGHDDELVVVALFHDLAEAFSDNHHGLVAAELLAPWLSARRRWLLIHHVEFQAVHFVNHPTRDRNERDRYRGHAYFDDTAQFCERYDQNSFDPEYPTPPLADFEPVVRRFFGAHAPPAVQPAD